MLDGMDAVRNTTQGRAEHEHGLSGRPADPVGEAANGSEEKVRSERSNDTESSSKKRIESSCKTEKDRSQEEP